MVCSSYNKYYDNLTKTYFSARWFVRAYLQNRDFRVPTEVETGFRILKQNRDNPAQIGTVGHAARVLGGSGGMVHLEKINWNLRSSNCWKCVDWIVNPTITTLFCIISKVLRSHQANHFGSLGGGGGEGVRNPWHKLFLHPSMEMSRVVAILYSTDSNHKAHNYYIVAGETAMSGNSTFLN